MGNPITHPEDLMVFFSEWPLQMIYDFYEAECDLLGETYCDVIESYYKHEDGVDIIRRYLLEYPDAFRFLLKECRCENLPNTKDETEIAEWLLNEEQPKYLHKIVKALSKGFIFEWIVYHQAAVEKKQFVESLCRFADSYENEYEDWLFKYNKLTRIEMTKEFGFRNNVLYYFYRRIIQCDCLRVLFHALNSNGRLNLAKHAEFITKGLRRHNLSYEVQIIYDNMCKEFPPFNWNKGITFVQDKKTTFSQVKYKKYEDTEIEKHKNFFIRKYLPHPDVCSEKKLLNRDELLVLIQDICSKWGQPTEAKWRVLWFYTYKYICEIKLINPYKDETTETEYKQKPYSRYVEDFIQYIHPTCDKKFQNILGKYVRGEANPPKLKDKNESSHINLLLNEFKERITDFIKKSQPIH